MDYIHYFKTKENHNSVYYGSNYTEPWVAYIEDNKDVTYNLKPFLMGTTASDFKPNVGAFSSYTFTSPTFYVEYTGDTLTDLNRAFNDSFQLNSITKSKLDTSNVTDMSLMFYDCTSLTDISGLSNWDISNVTNMRFMFGYCKKLTSISYDFNTSNVTDMSLMFYGCTSLTDISGLKSWDTSKVTDMQWMFYNCESLTDISGLSNWNTSNVNDMSDMFNGCSSLTTLDLSNFNTSKVTNMGYMFANCTSLKTVDLSNWDTSNVTDMNYMFEGCTSLTEVKVTKCSDETQNKILNQLKSDLTDYTWTLTDGVITRS